MAKPKQKYYVVWKGLNPGIYKDWETCKFQVNGVEGAMYKSFTSMEEAQAAYKDNPWNSMNTEKNIEAKKKASSEKIKKSTVIIHDSICVDAACAGNPGKMEYRGVLTSTGKEVFHQGPFLHGTNNIGEFLAIAHAAATLKKMGNSTTVIYTDSMTAISWIKKKQANTKLVRNASTEPLFELIERATAWLNKNKISNPIHKWETQDWGEIPADFGRK
jgi:ribonuclease HI